MKAIKKLESCFRGRHLALAVSGASHARELSFALTNFPRGLALDRAEFAAFMERRAPGRDDLSTSRREADEVEFLAGVEDGVTTGATIRGRIRNTNARPGDYGGTERTIPRPGHADWPQWVVEGQIPTGGGKNSGRLTATLCAAGGLALQWLATRGVSVTARIETIAGRARGFDAAIRAAKRDGDSVGGTVVCAVAGLRAGLGGALFDGVEGDLASALFAIPGVKGVEFGEGFAGTRLRGSEFNDAIRARNGAVVTRTNRQGGLLGGRTNGQDVVCRVALRPTPTVFRPQPSVDLATGRNATCEMKGRHDPCIVRRAVPVVEAVAALVVADLLLAADAARPRICLTLTGATLADDLAQLSSQSAFTDLVELRADLLTEAERRKAAEFPALAGVPVVLTFRRVADGGAFDGPEAERAAFFRRTLPGGGFAFVDFEDDFRDAKLAALARKAHVRVIRSLHDFSGPVRRVADRCREMVAGTDEIAKIAFRPKSLADVARLFRETRDFTDVDHIVLAMGPTGFASRVLAARTHSLLTYASVGGLGGLGHVTPYELVRTYRFRTVTRAATLFGVTGWPLKATRSPELNNAAFAAEDLDAVMVPFPARTAREAFAFMKAMEMKGMAVTIPHKLAIRPLLDRIDATAEAVGAVNTVVREEEGFVGYNTDLTGFDRAIRAFAGERLAGMRIAVLGDGGAAQAVKAAFREFGDRVRVFHRETPPPGYDLLVNATPVDPIPDYVFTGRELVYDLGYVPSVTPLMARAKAAGCRVENGLVMLREQAVEQRRRYGL